MQTGMEALEPLFRHIHIVDAGQFACWMNYGLGKLLCRGYRHGDVAVRNPLIERMPCEKSVVGIKILIVVFLSSKWTYR